ncbi:DNA-binding protein [Mariniluteicoccus flavus]
MMQQSVDDEVTATRARQIELYGEPLQTVLGRCATSLQLTQARVSELLGVSAPMLSQLINGRRIKIGNPAAAQRLQWMTQIAQQVEAGELALPEALAQLQANADNQDVFHGPTTTTGRRTRPLGAEIQEICRETAGAGEWLDAAALVAERHPDIAEFLRVFGAERADRAIAYADRVHAKG